MYKESYTLKYMYLFITLKMKIAFILYSIMVISWCECKRTPNTLIERTDMIANIASGLGRSKIVFIKLTSQNYGKKHQKLKQAWTVHSCCES